MTIKGAKRNVPHLLQAQQAPICLWSISETLHCQKFRGTVTKSTVSNRVCWSLKVLWGSVSADFRQFQVGREGKKERKIRNWQEEWMNPNSHIPYLQAQLAFAWHNRLVLDRRLSADSWYSRCSQPTLHRRYEGVQRSIANTHWITFYVLVALVDTMRLHGIQSSDPVALTSFSSIIRSLSIMVYAAKGDMAIKVMVLYVEMLGDRWPLESSLRPIWAVAIHAFIEGTFCFAYVLFATLGARD